ncbi:MAG: glycine hydroxymethyltransferase [Simkaniaceae bacterium]|nr:glycine hydroxymethyltransferase [Simkaniaceae bacterium]
MGCGATHVDRYLEEVLPENRHPGVLAYLATLDYLHRDHPRVAERIAAELRRQRTYLKMVASENYSSLAVQLAMGNLLTDKYAEGYPGHRFYSGCENVDAIETEAVATLKRLFGCDHAYVQPHSGADANLVAFWAILVQKVQNREVEALGKKSIDTLSEEEYESIRRLMVSRKIMGLALDAGGHLTHGFRHNVSGKMFRSIPYGVDRNTERIDYSALKKRVQEEKPTILVAGYSAYPRLLHFPTLREIADSVGAVLLVDMAHFSGLVAGKVLRGEWDPVPYAHIVTSTTHKTLRGPRGGMILCKEEFREVIDKGCPLVLGGPLPHVMAAKAVAFREAERASFREYAHRVVANARTLAEELLSQGVKLFTGGTENHLVVFDVAHTFSLTGKQAESALREGLITSNRNAIPFDENGFWYTSGVRFGTPALTSLGMGEGEMREIARAVVTLLKATEPAPSRKGPGLSRVSAITDPAVAEGVRATVSDLMRRFPLYPEIPDRV